MKTFDEFRSNQTQEQLNERFLRKGAGLVFARQSRIHGNRASRSFKSAKERFRFNPNASLEDQLKGLSDGLQELSSGLDELRNQNGAITSLALTIVLLSERE